MFHRHGIRLELILWVPCQKHLTATSFICTVIDYYTKSAEATALPSKHATGVVNFLYKVIMCAMTRHVQVFVSFLSQMHSNFKGY